MKKMKRAGARSVLREARWTKRNSLALCFLMSLFFFSGRCLVAAFARALTSKERSFLLLLLLLLREKRQLYFEAFSPHIRKRKFKNHAASTDVDVENLPRPRLRALLLVPLPLERSSRLFSRRREQQQQQQQQQKVASNFTHRSTKEEQRSRFVFSSARSDEEE